MLQRALAWLASFRLRTLFRAVFLLLTGATLALALTVLKEEKQQSLDSYRDSFRKTRDQIAARLRHPSGQLALLNPHSGDVAVTPLHPLLLPYASLDVDELDKVRNAVDMSGCLVHYPHDASVCVAVGANPWAGAFIYASGRLASRELVPRKRGEKDFSTAHRLRIEVKLRGEEYHWLAPYEVGKGASSPNGHSQRGRLTGFVEVPDGNYLLAHPQRDFRGWVWQSSACMPGRVVENDCEREVFYAVRLPIELLRQEQLSLDQPQWPPSDLDDIAVHLQFLAPGKAAPLFDSNDEEARAPFLLADLQSLLLPGETLHIRRLDDANPPQDIYQLVGLDDSVEPVSPFLLKLIRQLPVDSTAFPLETRKEISTPVGRFELVLDGDARSAERILARATTRMAWFVGAMLFAIVIAWFLIELGIIRRVAKLTRRAQSVQRSMSGMQGLEQLDVADLRSGDELGILAACLHDLLRRVREDITREKIRAEQEKDMWHAVGHEIMSPLQSLIALHPGESEPDHRYLARMQQAIRVLYGAASPSEAFEASRLQLGTVDLDVFLREVADNAPGAGIDDVRYESSGADLHVRADEYSLEDVVTHVLKNANRYRTTGTSITMTTEVDDDSVRVNIHNCGSQISPELIDKIFEYGVSDQADSAAEGNRGQGLFVAKTYMAKMGGTISVQNTGDGVVFVLRLMRV